MRRKRAIEIIESECYVINPLNFDRTTMINTALDMAVEALKQQPCDDMGEVSDGYHTFNQLYHQRAILFATIVNQNKDISWKSYKHSDGEYCFNSNGEWFIVGIDTPDGSYTYHYSKDYWDYFDCKELDCGKEWDGHTEEDVTRLLSLKREPVLEKIRAEIEEYKSRQLTLAIGVDDLEKGKQIAIEYILGIIDKYKAESEEA